MGLYLMLHLGQSRKLPGGVCFPVMCRTDWGVTTDVIRLCPFCPDPYFDRFEDGRRTAGAALPSQRPCNHPEEPAHVATS